MFARPLCRTSITASTTRAALSSHLSQSSRIQAHYIQHFTSSRLCYQQYTNSSARAFNPKKNSISPTNLVIALSLSIVGAFIFKRYTTSLHPSPRDDQLAKPQVSTLPTDHDFLELLGMPSQIQPGRPGNLTADQEAKLRELWALTLKVFGVTGERTSLDVPNGTATPTPASSESASLSTPDKKKKGRLSLFSKKHKDDNDGSSTASSGAATPTDLSTLSDEDDKHGQTKAYREALAKSSPEELRNAFWSMTKHDHPDGLLLRFLRARKWDVGAALVMLISTMHWRATEMHVDSDIMAKGELGMMDETRSASAAERKEGEDFISQMRMGKSFLHGIDREGRPMCFVRVRLHRQGEQSEASLERFTVYTIETARMLLRPPVDTATIVFDMTNFSMSNMDYTPVKFMIKCFEANYPESLGAVLVHKSPWIFQGIWNIIRGWLDPVVAGKVHFTKNVEELETYVPRTQIPRELGGDEDWEYRYVEPQPGENDAMKDVQSRQRLVEEREGLVRRYEELLLDWIGGGGEAAGRSEERNKIAEELRRNYWNLDPYVRARSLYDRTGVIQRGGALQFYPPPRRGGRHEQ